MVDDLQPSRYEIDEPDEDTIRSMWNSAASSLLPSMDDLEGRPRSTAFRTMQIHLDALRDLCILTSQRKNILAPMHALPREVLLKIFDEAGEKFDLNLLGDATDSWFRHMRQTVGLGSPVSHVVEIIKITHVCRYWREVNVIYCYPCSISLTNQLTFQLSLGCPPLWTSLTTEDQRSKYGFPQILRRARQVPLSVIFEEDAVPDETVVAKDQHKKLTFPLVPKSICMAQVRHLNLSLICNVTEAVRRLFDTPMPLLEVLRLHLRTQHVTLLPSDALDSFAPHLQRVSLVQCTIDLQVVVDSALSRLTHLAIAYTPSVWGNESMPTITPLTSESLSQVFSKMSNLEELALSSAPPFMYPDGYSPRTTWSSSILLPPNLKHLAIRGIFERCMIDPVNIASRLRVPVHTHVDIDVPILQMDPSLDGLLEGLGGGPRAPRVLQLSTDSWQTKLSAHCWLEDDVARPPDSLLPSTLPHSRFELMGRKDRDFLVPLSDALITSELVHLIVQVEYTPKFRTVDLAIMLEKAKNVRAIEFSILAPQRPKVAHGVALLELLSESRAVPLPETGVTLGLGSSVVVLCPFLETLIVHFHGRKNCAPSYFEGVVEQLAQLLRIRVQSQRPIRTLRLPEVLSEYADPLCPIVPDLGFL